MKCRYRVQKPGWGDHQVGELLEYVDAEHMHFVVPVISWGQHEEPADNAPSAPEKPTEKPAEHA